MRFWYLSHRPAAKALSLHTRNMEVDEDADQNLDLLIGFANKDEYKCHLPISDKYQNLMCWPIYTMENQNFVASN